VIGAPSMRARTVASVGCSSLTPRATQETALRSRRRASPWPTEPDHTAGDLMPDDLMPDDRDARLAELRRLRLGDILYPGNSGCAGARGGSGAPGPCQGEVTVAAMKYYRGPKRPHHSRIFLCDLHAASRPPSPSPTRTGPSSPDGRRRLRTGRRSRRGSAPRTAWSAGSRRRSLDQENLTHPR
jgi:hypothetical protein